MHVIPLAASGSGSGLAQNHFALVSTFLDFSANKKNPDFIVFVLQIWSQRGPRDSGVLSWLLFTSSCRPPSLPFSFTKVQLHTDTSIYYHIFIFKCHVLSEIKIIYIPFFPQSTHQTDVIMNCKWHETYTTNDKLYLHRSFHIIKSSSRCSSREIILLIIIFVISSSLHDGFAV